MLNFVRDSKGILARPRCRSGQEEGKEGGHCRDEQETPREERPTFQDQDANGRLVRPPKAVSQRPSEGGAISYLQDRCRTTSKPDGPPEWAPLKYGLAGNFSTGCNMSESNGQIRPFVLWNSQETEQLGIEVGARAPHLSLTTLWGWSGPLCLCNAKWTDRMRLWELMAIDNCNGCHRG